MKPSTKETRDRWRKVCAKERYQKFSIEYGGMDFDWYLMPATSVPPDLRMGIMQFTPTLAEWEELENSPQEIFFVLSDAVPEQFRQFWVLHEAVEFLPDEFGRRLECADASQIELSIALNELPQNERKHYVELRRNFFRDLVSYAKRHKQSFDAATIYSFECSLRFFTEIAGQMRIAE